MNENFRTWWQGRTLREQRMLLAMFGLAAVVLAWLLIIRPLSDALSAARERHSEAVVALADVRAQVAAIGAAQQPAATASLSGPVEVIVRESAEAAGFPVTRINAVGAGQASVIIDAVRPQAFFGWVAQMESRGLIVDRLSANPNGDQTLSVNVTFRARGG